MIKGSARSRPPKHVAEGGNRPELDAVGHTDLLNSFPAVLGALHFAIGGNTPEGYGRANPQFVLLAECPHPAHRRWRAMRGLPDGLQLKSRLSPARPPPSLHRYLLLRS